MSIMISEPARNRTASLMRSTRTIRFPRPLRLPDDCTIQFPAVMGVLNVTPDSFSDGGRYLDPGPRRRSCARDGSRRRRHHRHRR